MDPGILRVQFRDFCGQDEYVKWLRVLNSFGREKGRLRSWQESLWEEFLLEYPSNVLNFAEIQEAFRICDVHDRELTASSAEIRERFQEFAFALASDQGVKLERFPYPSGEWYCPTCWDDFLAWEPQHRWTLLSYKPGFEKTMIEKEGAIYERVVAHFGANLRDGDELWRVTSPKSHWENRCGREYVVLVREWRVVDAYLKAMS
jgi:hypothetical protein